ncbi:MAG: LPXTG cell wall anchor domain-containing protein [Acidimicrobiales bacterium]
MDTNRTAQRTMRVGLGALMVGAVMLVGGLAPAGASVGDPSPDHFDFDSDTKNVDCTDAEFGLNYSIQFKINEQPTAKTYTDGTHSVTISNVESPGGRMEFDWSSPEFWDAVIVKQADEGLIYKYDPALKADQNVQTVEGQNSGGISHVTFCSDGVDPTTSTSSTTTSSTTTTTEATTTTAAATVLGAVVTQPATQVLGAQVLPATGASSTTTMLATLGGVLVLAGGIALLIGGRKARLS